MTEINCVMARIGELWLKSEPVKKQFMKTLKKNIKSALDSLDLEYNIEEFRGRILIHGDAEKIADAVSKVFGVVDVSLCRTTSNTKEDIAAAALEFARVNLKAGMTFAVSARRKFVEGFTSQQLAAFVADKIWEEIPGFVVDLKNPEYEIFVEAREYGGIVYDNRIPGQGGLPLGTAGRAVVLLSSGIDSPAAAYLMMKRGVSMSGVFADSGKWAGKDTKALALDNARILSKWCPGRAFPLRVINLEKFLSEVYEKCDTHYTCLFCKRFMLKAAEAIAAENRFEGIVTGENLGQVASQTLQNMSVISSCTDSLILRPLLTYDKEEIVTIARKIGTFHEFCGDTKCLAVPKKPATCSNNNVIRANESRLDIEELVKDAVENAELWIARDGEIYRKL